MIQKSNDEKKTKQDCKWRAPSRIHSPYQDVLYCQNIIRFHAIGVKVISFTHKRTLSLHRFSRTSQGQEIYNVRVQINLRSKLKYDCQQADIHRTHACSAIF
jgi:hypothetical protein